MIETYEDQARTIWRILNGRRPTSIECRHLEHAARNLEELGVLRRKMLNFAGDDLSRVEMTEEQLDILSEDVLRLLHLPTQFPPHQAEPATDSASLDHRACAEAQTLCRTGS